MASVADVPEVKVLALSPRCWPISPFCYMEEPGRFFSASLSSPLDEFADFCRQSECCSSGCAWGSGRGPCPREQLGQEWQECWGVLGVPGRVAPGPRADGVSGRPEPAGLGVHEAAAVAVDVAGPCRTAVWRLCPPGVHAADVHPAVLQQC